jgi:unsaturated chondroitin disaccharide hydrolase
MVSTLKSKSLIVIGLVGLLVSNQIEVSAQSLNIKKEFTDAALQTSYLLKQVDSARKVSAEKLVFPRTLVDGKLKLISSTDWTSGFFPGELWYLYEFTKQDKWKTAAEKYTELMSKEQYNTHTHDLGFMIYCSYGNGYRLTKDTTYKKVIIQAAKSLITRFNPKVGVIKSWDHNTNVFTYPVIIDNMMNLELLFMATKFTGDSSYYKIAVQHANTTMKNHFRADFSSFHVVDYNPETGAVIKKLTHQGYSDESAWARGQAWGLYGYTMAYRETRDPKYLALAKEIASFIMKNPNRPADHVPYWDYNAPNIPDAPRDASAAAITSSALYELEGYAKGNKYKQEADFILNQLSKNYKSPINKNEGFLLLHSTGHLPAKSEIDVPINYADYYYLEACLRSKMKF